jgi:uncharacterized protein YndB with AHSA1/START domain
MTFAGTHIALGTFLDRHTLRFELRYPHPVGRVWAALTDPAQLAAWFMPVEMEPRVGGKFVMPRSDGTIHGAGVISALEPERSLEVTFLEGETHFGPGCLMRFDVAPAEDGTRVTFTHNVAPDVVYPMPGQIGGPGTFPPGTAAGWHGFADGLARALDGRHTPIYDEDDELLMAAREDLYRDLLIAVMTTWT